MDPRIGEPLPHADEAYIDPRKLLLYALDPGSARGRHKAIVFERALDITAADWRYLHDSILRAVPHHPISGVRPPRTPEQVTTWEVLLPVTGINGRVLQVRTAWRMDTGLPELVMAQVQPTRLQPPELRGTL